MQKLETARKIYFEKTGEELSSQNTAQVSKDDLGAVEGDEESCPGTKSKMKLPEDHRERDKVCWTESFVIE